MTKKNREIPLNVEKALSRLSEDLKNFSDENLMITVRRKDLEILVNYYKQIKD